MSRDLKGLIRFAMENSDGTQEAKIDPEWLKEVLTDASVDLVQQLKEDIEMLSHFLSSQETAMSDAHVILEDMLSLTEDIDLANDFLKMDGTRILTELLFNGPQDLKADAYQLLANVTQNNAKAQEICLMKMSRDLKGLIRFAMENSDGTQEAKIDPEETAMSDAHVILEDMLSLTEDIDLANDFLKMDGTRILTELLFNGPQDLKADAYQLLANVTQNNAKAQEICLREKILEKLILHLHKESDRDCLKKLLLGISCLTRGYPPGVSEFQQADGFQNVLNLLDHLVSQASGDDVTDVEKVCAKGAFLIYCLLQEVLPSKMGLTRGYPPGVSEFQQADGFQNVLNLLDHLVSQASGDDVTDVEKVCAKGAFLIYCLLQEVLPSKMDESIEKDLASKLVKIAMLVSDAQEHLLASLILLLTNSSSIDMAIDVENIPETTLRRTRSLICGKILTTFKAWLKVEDDKIALSNDPAHAELRSYLGVLRHLLNK
ncbi:hypothetical protein AHF37_04062 [Paragonimus kellicotti]|nr:hypothetical protein AHF37_04062 [Paragonimus kellicotti]